ncbi:MAG: sulfate transporter, periplasmic sulfate-binding protein [Gaiellaceae bacterium]|nr:sulfate transporter, periplasmic sulfate-binding protein [Gaiellaceae bacterium]
MRGMFGASATAVLLAALASGCGGESGGGASGGGTGEGETTLALAGEGVSFQESYAASGEQSRAVAAGLPADVVAFSLEPDVTRLVDEGLVDATWSEDEHGGMVSDSVVVFAVRKGNPQGIRTWADLTREGIEVITPNPFTSGGAQWNVLAAYGAQLELGKSEEEAVEYLRQLFRNVSVQDKSAREALQTFVGGKGDVLIAYENEARLAQSKGEELDYVVPDETILIENPIAVVGDGGNAAAAQAFVDFVRSPEAQRVFGEAGYRPILADVLAEFDYPAPPQLFTIADLGGWGVVRERFFDVEGGIMADVQRELGQALE